MNSQGSNNCGFGGNVGGGGYDSVASGNALVNGHYNGMNVVGGFGAGMGGLSVGGGLGIESWSNQGAMPLLPLF